MDKTGSTALMYAAWMGHFDVVKLLVEQHNANVNIVNDKGGSAWQYANSSGHELIATYLKKYVHLA